LHQTYCSFCLTLLDSLVSSQVYDIIKTIYSTTANETTEEGRIKVLQSTLGQLRLNNIATLDAVITHFTRLIDLTSADDTYISSLAQALAPCILRPRFESSLTMNERHSYRLIRDLFNHKDAIFGELKRQSSTNIIGVGAGQARPRAISTDESNRRAAVEARNRAIASRSRATSPAPSARHRRDRSTDGSAATRFPVHVSGPQTERRGAPNRQSLDVPSNTAPSPEIDPVSKPEYFPEDNELNGSADQSSSPNANTNPPGAAEENSANITTTSDELASANTAEVEKHNSFSRSSNRYSRGKTAGGLHRSGTGASVDSITASSNRNNNPAAAAPGGEDLKGVTLDDKPMDDFA
jgi:hypothetical protein